MTYGAIDLHMRYSQIRIIDEAGVVRRDQRVVTSRERLVNQLRSSPLLRLLRVDPLLRPLRSSTARVST